MIGGNPASWTRNDRFVEPSSELGKKTVLGHYLAKKRGGFGETQHIRRTPGLLAKNLGRRVELGKGKSRARKRRPGRVKKRLLPFKGELGTRTSVLVSWVWFSGVSLGAFSGKLSPRGLSRFLSWNGFWKGLREEARILWVLRSLGALEFIRLVPNAWKINLLLVSRGGFYFWEAISAPFL